MICTTLILKIIFGIKCQKGLRDIKNYMEVIFVKKVNLSYDLFIIIATIGIIGIIIIVKKMISVIRQDIKYYKKLGEREKDKIKMLLLIFLAPIVLLLLDSTNAFSKIFPNYSNLSREYDWLSFIGAYLGAIISSILLIFITEKDRNENTAVLRTSQRPYLDITYMKIQNDFFIENKNKITIFKHGNLNDKQEEKSEYLTLCIKNTGASVAIINTNKTKIKLQYILDDVMNKEELTLNFQINRLSIGSGQEVYIKIYKNELYNNGKLLDTSKILSSVVYYKDLFNKEYYDECELKDNLKVLHDNEEIE